MPPKPDLALDFRRMAVLMSVYEREMRHPLRHLVQGQLARAMLIQVQKLKARISGPQKRDGGGDFGPALCRTPMAQAIPPNRRSIPSPPCSSSTRSFGQTSLPWRLRPPCRLSWPWGWQGASLSGAATSCLPACLPACLRRGERARADSDIAASRVLRPRAPDSRQLALPCRLAITELERQVQEAADRCDPDDAQLQAAGSPPCLTLLCSRHRGVEDPAELGAVLFQTAKLRRELERTYSSSRGLFSDPVVISEWASIDKDLETLGRSAVPLASRLRVIERMSRSYTVFGAMHRKAL